jgi:glycosyltransferase involved in cell wall biosynthesis
LDKNLHIVSHDVPWPADYGGVIDIFYTLKALHEQGVNIHLHCFTKGRQTQKELEKYCSSVQYYARKQNSSSFSFNIPLIVNSRVNEALIANLQKDNYPILLEGIHCTYYLNNDQLKNRQVVVRLFNTEFEYYKQLANHETNLFKKIYYLHESRLLKKYENAIAAKGSLLALSKQDVDIYKLAFDAPDIHFLPVFLPHTPAVGNEGKGCFCLYHGNLAINENEKAATWLLKHVFNQLSIPFVIAGKNPSKKLQKLAHASQHTCLVANPSEKEMQDMITKAHIHVLPSFNNTGVKLKLLNAMFTGRHCLVNKAGVAGSELEQYCHIAEDAHSFQEQIQALYLQPFTELQVQERQLLLQTTYNNEVNALELIKHLW